MRLRKLLNDNIYHLQIRNRNYYNSCFLFITSFIHIIKTNREDLENILESSHNREDAIELILSLFKEPEHLGVGDKFILNKEMYKCTLKREYTVESIYYTKDIVMYQFKNDNDQLSFIYHTELL